MAERRVSSSTRDAVVEMKDGGFTFRSMARELGDERLSTTLCAIYNDSGGVSLSREKRVRSAMGLPEREMKPSELHRKELSTRLRGMGVTWTQAMEIALYFVENI